jgi:hypothetical protein
MNKNKSERIRIKREQKIAKINKKKAEAEIRRQEILQRRAAMVARMPKRRGKLLEWYFTLLEQIRTNKKAYIVFAIMQTMTIFVFIRSLLHGQVESCMVCVLCFALFLIPPILEKNFKVKLPTVLESLAYIFVFCAEVLGEIECYYIKFPFWDTMLHTINGFMFAAFGFCLVDIFNRHDKFRFRLSAGFLAVVAFCFSMTIGILWEFVEYSADHLLGFDMQKDTLVSDFSSVYIDETNSNKAIKIDNIEKTVVYYGDGSELVIDGGYLDIGINDTIQDLFVNFVGAVVFSCIGYVYVKQRGKGRLAASFIPEIEEDPEEYLGPENME